MAKNYSVSLNKYPLSEECGVELLVILMYIFAVSITMVCQTHYSFTVVFVHHSRLLDFILDKVKYRRDKF